MADCLILATAIFMLEYCRFQKCLFPLRLALILFDIKKIIIIVVIL